MDNPKYRVADLIYRYTACTTVEERRFSAAISALKEMGL
jgi:hypothetical protein